MVDSRRSRMNDTNTTLGVQIAIANLKQEAISLGFDFPTQDIAQAKPEELYEFYLELENFISENR
jgi:hypothetical protein